MEKIFENQEEAGKEGLNLFTKLNKRKKYCMVQGKDYYLTPDNIWKQVKEHCFKKVGRCWG